MWLLLLFSDRFSRFFEGGGVDPVSSAALRFLLRYKGVITLSPAGVITCAIDCGKDGGMRGGDGGRDSIGDCGEAGECGVAGECGRGESGPGESSEVGISCMCTCAGVSCGDTSWAWLSTPFTASGCAVTSLLTHTSLMPVLSGSVAWLYT